MTITAEQREQRRSHIGSSDVAAILGVSPFANAADVYWSKQGVDAPETEAMRTGTRFEDAVLDWLEGEIGQAMYRSTQAVCKDDPLFVANLDALLVHDNVPVEVKTTGVVGPVHGYWGETWTDDVPEHVIWQVQHQMLCTDASEAYVAALIGGRGFRVYRIERNHDLIAYMVEECRKFWGRVEAQIPPPEAPSLAVAKAIPRVEGKTIEVERDLIREAEDLRKAHNVLGRLRKKADAALLHAMGDAEIGETGNKRVRRCKVTRGDSVHYVLRFGTDDDGDDE